MPDPLLTDTRTLNAVVSASIEPLRKQFVDNASRNIQFLAELLKQGNIDRRSGGDRIREGLFTDFNDNVKFLTSGSDTFDTAHQQEFTNSFWQWKQVIAPITIWLDELLKTQSPAGQIPILPAKTEAAQRTLYERIGNATIGVFSNIGDALTGLSGIQAIVSATPSANTVGSIAGTTVSKDGTAFWQNITATDNISDWSDNGIDRIREAVYRANRGADKVNLHVTSDVGARRLLQTLTNTREMMLPLSQPMGQPRVADSGVADVAFDGAPVLYDVNNPAADWRALNTRYLKLYFMDGAEFLPIEFVRPNNALYVVGGIYSMMELVTNARNRHAYIGGANSAF